MDKFDILTKYIPLIQEDEIGLWVIDKENDGRSESPIQMPFVDYSEIVDSFMDDVYALEASNKYVGLSNYQDVLKSNEIDWGMESMKKADVSNLDEQCILAFIMAAIRAERFSYGALFEFFENGPMLKWLKRLR